MTARPHFFSQLCKCFTFLFKFVYMFTYLLKHTNYLLLQTKYEYTWIIYM